MQSTLSLSPSPTLYADLTNAAETPRGVKFALPPRSTGRDHVAVTCSSKRERRLVLLLVCTLHIAGAFALTHLAVSQPVVIAAPISIALIAGPDAAGETSDPVSDSFPVAESHDLASPPTPVLTPPPPAPEPVVQPTPEPVIETPPPKPEPKPEPRPRPEPKPEPRPQPRPEQRPAPEPTVSSPTETSNTVDPTSATASTTPSTATPGPRAATPGQASASGTPASTTAPRFDAAYLNNPAPAYPALSRRMREEGRVLLRVLVSPDGRPTRIELAETSGSSRLDAAAQGAVTRWQFVPARRGDRPVEAWVVVPVVFKLEGR